MICIDCGVQTQVLDVCLWCSARRVSEAARLHAHREPNPPPPPATSAHRLARLEAFGRDAGSLPVAAVGDVGGHSDAEAAACVVGYNRALADSLKSAEQILDKLAEEHWPLVALVGHLKERLAEDSGRLGWNFSGDDLLGEVARVGVKADVVTRGG